MKIIIIILLIIALLSYAYYKVTKSNNEYFEPNKISNSLFLMPIDNDTDNMKGKIIIAVDKHEDDIYFFTVKSTPKLDYNDFKQKIDNHEYRFVDPDTDTNPLTKLLYDNEKNATYLNLMGSNHPDSNLTKLDLVTGIPEIVVYDSPEYILIRNIIDSINNSFDALKVKTFELAPYDIDNTVPPMHDIFIKLGKN